MIQFKDGHLTFFMDSSIITTKFKAHHYFGEDMAMRNTILLCLCPVLLFILLLISPIQNVCSQEDTANLSLKKTASPDQKTRPYVVKKGEWIFDIMRNQVGITSRDFSLIKKFNPQIKNFNKIYPGQVLQLPQKSIAVTKQGVKTPQVEPTEAKKIEQKEKTVMPPENRLDIIRAIMGRMNSSFVTTGKHFIPIPQMGQVTIDCSMIPVAELEDGSIVLVDFTDRITDPLKKTIQTSWQNYHVVKAASNDDVAAILQKIINASNAYTMTKEIKPFALGNNPSIKLMLDWTISKKTSLEGKPYSHGLVFVSDNSQLLSRPMIAYAEKNGMIISEIMDGRGLVSAPDLKYRMTEMPVITGNSGKDLIYSLLVTLGYAPVKDTEVIIFDSVRDNFNLTIKADLLVKKGDRYMMIHSKKLSQQYIDTLKNRGTDATFLEEGASRKSVIEKTLQVMKIPYSFDNFSFSEPKKTTQRRETVVVSAFKIARDKGFVYLIDFDMDRDLYGLLHHQWEVNIVKY
jgi:hypothetical protein